MKFASLLLLTATLLSTAAAQQNLPLNAHFEPFRPLLGKTWRGEFKGAGAEAAKIDIASWERILNGEAIRVLHSINDGEYGGETIIIWDAAKKSLVHFYFTTAGFRTTGTFKFDWQKFAAEEEVAGATQGITKVRSSGELRADGTLTSKSEYFKDGQWVPGHELVYREDAKAEVKFK
jgi:hypothetical protein